MKRAVPWMIAGLLALAAFSGYLAAHRIYQVDECQYVAMAKIVAEGRQNSFYTDASAFTWSISRVIADAARSADMFLAGRAAMLALFWLNIVLIALCTGASLVSSAGLSALLAAATLAPLWDYGLEIRHDNVMLTSLLLTWYLLRVRPRRTRSFLAAGALAAALEFLAFKSFVYAIPLSAAFLIRAPKTRLRLAWLTGFAVAACAAIGAWKFLGLWDAFAADARGYFSASMSTARFLPFETLSRLLWQTPLLAVLLAAAARDRARRPEAWLCAGALILLFVNPTPYPYNLLHFVPYAFLFAYPYAVELLRRKPRLRPLLLAAHLIPFSVATARHFSMTKARQQTLMFLAESLTSEHDPVFDATGLVTARPMVGYHWYLQSLNRRNFIDGTWPSVREMLAREPAPVLIRNYRFDWLAPEDRAFIDARYVKLADDFLVLGNILPPRGGTFAIARAGRYRISSYEDSDLAWSPHEDSRPLRARLDGRPAEGAVELAVGPHVLTTNEDRTPCVVWLGPSLDRIAPLPPADRERLFVNWY